MRNENMTLGNRIAARRKELKMTQDALARAVGVSAQAVSKWENDQSCPDISILPQLAQTLGLSVDALLGAEPEIPVYQGEVVTGDDGEDEGSGSFQGKNGDVGFDFHAGPVELHMGPSKRFSLTIAAWLIVTALLMLAQPVLKPFVSLGSMGFWNALWISGLTVWGTAGLFRRIDFVHLVAALAGVYLGLNQFGVLPLALSWEILLPVLVLLLGVSLLLDSFRKKKKASSGIHVHTAGTDRVTRVEDGFLTYVHNFGEDDYRVSTQELKGGRVEMCFGEFTLDLSGVEQVAEDCVLDLEAQFGDFTLLVPSRFRADLALETNFANREVKGAPQAQPEGVIHVNAEICFGSLTVRYI